MTVLEILKLVSLYLNLYDNFSPIFSGSTTLSKTEDQQELNKVLVAINTTTKSLSCLYKLKFKEEITFANNTFDALLLSKKLNKIISIKNKMGNKIPFKIVANKITCSYCGAATIEYFYFPNEAENLNDNVDLNSVICPKTFAMGVVSEYCYINNLFDDAAVWEERFLKSLNKKALSNSVVLPKRNWA